jgi:predicted DNA-binding transcriptional regulator AlpA
MRKRLRYTDLAALGIVRNRTTLQNWINKQNFPVGQMTGPNSRTWDQGEVEDWLDSRPAAQKAVPKSKGRPRKADRAGVEA